MAEDRDKKLKELEENLAKELDQELSKSKIGNSDSDKVESENKADESVPSEGGVDTEPSEDLSEEVSLEDIGAINEADVDESNDDEDNSDEEELQKPKELTPEELDAQLLGEYGKASTWQRFLDKIFGPILKVLEPFRPLIDKLYNFYADFDDHARKLSALDIKGRIKFFRDGISTFKKSIKLRVKAFQNWVLAQKEMYKDWSTNKKFSFIALIVVVITIIYVLPRWYRIVPSTRVPGLLRSFADVNGLMLVKASDRMISVDIVEEQLKHVVLLERVVANIQRSSSSSSRPMALIEFYVETTNREASVEVQRRESEIRDFATRLLESMSFGELNTEIGKNRYRSKVKEFLNRILNTGQAKRVYYKTYRLKK